MSLHRPLALVAALVAATSSLTGADIWVEGEKPTSQAVTRHPWWYDQVKKNQLSGGDFISNWGDKVGTVSYAVEAPEAGDYTFFVRANPTGTKLEWRIDEGAWAVVDFGPQTDQINIAADNKPDLRFLCWIKVAKPTLTAGKHTVEFRFGSDNNHHGMLDCFALTTGGFVPKGTRKPGEAGPVAVSTEGRWAFDPEQDAFSPDSLLDLRSLNEKVAGETGFITRTKDGNDFARGDGQPIRFWAMHSDVWTRGKVALKEHARFLAKRGVNLVRCHANLPSPDGALDQPNQAMIQQLWECVAAMKAEGIYVMISPYYPHATGLDDARKQRWGITTKAGNMTGLVYFDPKVQDAYKKWVRALMEPVNPETGIALKDDPALAILQMQNEDSLLFWTFNELIENPGLQTAFATWATKTHGSVQKALDAWQEPCPGDDAANGKLGLRNIWDMTSDGAAKKGRSPRLAAQSRFLTDLMRDWNSEIHRFVREDLKAKQLINAGNWRTADPVTLGDLEHYAYTVNEVQAMNRYTGSYHNGPNAGWAVAQGDTYAHYTALKEPTTIPVNIKQPVGFPYIIPESSWVPPTMYQSEAPLLVSSYMSLGGVDAYFWFSTGDTQWTDAKSANGYLPSVGKWVAATPELLGQFPAAALMYRKGYVQRGKPVVHEERALDDMYAVKIPVISEEGAFDPNRDAGSFAANSVVRQEVSRLAYLAGPVEVVYGGDPAKTVVSPDLAKLIDDKAKTVTSNTGELAFDYGKGLCRVDTPKAQGVTGFLKEASPSTKLADITVDSTNDYATVLAVALDDQPLKASKSVLVQIGTHCRPTDWAEQPTTINDGGRTFPGFTIENHGHGPWQVVKNATTVTIRNAGLKEAVALDMNGMPRKDAVKVEQADGGLKVTLPADAMYVIVR